MILNILNLQVIVKVIEIIFEKKFHENIVGITSKYGVKDLWISSEGKDGRYLSRLLVPSV